MKNWSENWIDDDFNIRRVDIIVCLIQPRQVQQQWGYPDVLTLLVSIEFPDSIELTQRHWHSPESTELWRASTHDKKRNPCLLLLSMSSPYLIVHGTTYCKYVFKKIISLLIRPHPNYNQPHIIQLINTRTILRLGRIWLSCFNRDVSSYIT